MELPTQLILAGPQVELPAEQPAAQQVEQLAVPMELPVEPVQVEQPAGPAAEPRPGPPVEPVQQVGQIQDSKELIIQPSVHLNHQKIIH